MSDHYFDRSPTSDDQRRDVTARIWDREMVFTTSSGVFSHDGLDKATAVLLRHSTPPTAGVVLDLGCGWGPIACAVAAAGATVWAVDVNERALELTRLNAERLGVTVHAVFPEDVPDDLVVDQIWSNPPIRIGKQALHDLLLQLAAPPVPRRRRPAGRRQEPRRGLAAALARRAGLADRPRRQRQGLSHPRGPATAHLAPAAVDSQPNGRRGASATSKPRMRLRIHHGQGKGCGSTGQVGAEVVPRRANVPAAGDTVTVSARPTSAAVGR